MDGSIRSVAIGDFYGDGTDEIIVGCGVASETSVWAYDCRGNQLRLAAAFGSQIDIAESYGVFGNGISPAILTVITCRKSSFLRITAAFRLMRSMVRWLWPMRLNLETRIPGICKNLSGLWSRANGRTARWDTDQNKTSLTERSCMEFGHAGSVIDDLDGDGDMEIVVTGIVMDHPGCRQYVLAQEQYMTVCVFNGDRTRYVNTEKGFDWTSFPSGLGAGSKTRPTQLLLLSCPSRDGRSGWRWQQGNPL